MTTVGVFDWLRDNPPATPKEARAAAEAMLRARDTQAALEALKALTPKEVALAEEAYHAGMSAMRDALLRAIGPAAVTLNADYVRQITPLADIRFRMLQPETFLADADVRAARIALHASQVAERQEQQS